MPRPKRRPSIDSQLRNLIATATEEKLYTLAQKLITILQDSESPEIKIQFGPPAGRIASEGGEG